MNATVCQLQIKELEEQLENQALHKEISRLKQQLELLEEDKKELELKCQNSEEKARDLKHSGNHVIIFILEVQLVGGSEWRTSNRIMHVTFETPKATTFM